MKEFPLLDPSKPYQLSRQQLMEPSWDLPRAREIGSMRALCRGISASSAALSVGIVPFGQGSMVHANTAEHIIMGLEGKECFEVAGVEYDVGPFDLLFIPARARYRHYNKHDRETRFVSVLGKTDVWPPSGIYDDVDII
jgi:hypothetical protein